MNTEINGNKMKSKQLRALIREAITEVLNEDANALVTTRGGTKSVSYKTPAELSDLKSDPNVSSIETTGGARIKEMARIAKGYELVDPEMDETPFGTKTISGTSLANIITFFREHPGAEKTDIQSHFGFVRPQIANAIVNGLTDRGILRKMGTVTTVDDETGETIPEPEEAPTRFDVEDFFIGNKPLSGFFNHGELPSEEDEFESPEEPEIPELPSDASVDTDRLSDEDYNAWMEYSKYKDRLAKTKSALTQVKKQRKDKDDLSYDSTEVDRLAVKKAEYEARLQSIIDSNEYVKNKVGQDTEETEDELTETVLRRLKKLANI
jgi:hypothetical protein